MPCGRDRRRTRARYARDDIKLGGPKLHDDCYEMTMDRWRIEISRRGAIRLGAANSVLFGLHADAHVVILAMMALDDPLRDMLYRK